MWVFILTPPLNRELGAGRDTVPGLLALNLLLRPQKLNFLTEQGVRGRSPAASRGQQWQFLPWMRAGIELGRWHGSSPCPQPPEGTELQVPNIPLSALFGGLTPKDLIFV